MLIANDNPDLIMITEIIPKAQINPISLTRLAIDGYNLYTNFDYNLPNLGKSGKRGVIIYVSNSLTPFQISVSNSAFEEQLWIRFDLPRRHVFLVGCIYRSPSANLASSTNLLCELLHDVCALRPTHLLLVGDFNFNQINWDTFTANDVGLDTQCYDDFLLTISECGLYQHITEPTHFRSNQIPSILDLVFTNEEGMITNLEYLPPLGNSDHICLRFHFNIAISSNKYTRPHYKLNSGDYDNMRFLLDEINWYAMNDMAPDEAWQYFFNNFNAIIDRTVPKSNSKVKYKNVYINKEAMKLRKRKLVFWRQYCTTLDPIDYARFTQTRNRLRSLTRKLRYDYESLLANGIMDITPRHFGIMLILN